MFGKKLYRGTGRNAIDEFRAESLLSNYNNITETEKKQVDTFLKNTNPVLHTRKLMAMLGKTGNVQAILKQLNRLSAILSLQQPEADFLEQEFIYDSERYPHNVIRELLGSCDDDTFETVLQFREEYCLWKFNICLVFKKDQGLISRRRVMCVYNHTEYEPYEFAFFLIVCNYQPGIPRDVFRVVDSNITLFMDIVRDIPWNDYICELLHNCAFRYRRSDVTHCLMTRYHTWLISGYLKYAHPDIVRMVISRMFNNREEIIMMFPYNDANFAIFSEYLSQMNPENRLTSLQQLREQHISMSFEFGICRAIVDNGLELLDGNDHNQSEMENLIMHGRCLKLDNPEFLGFLLDYPCPHGRASA